VIVGARAIVRLRLNDADRGSVAIWFVITAPVLLLMAVLIVDGGAKITAGEQAASYAAEAARAASIAGGPSSGDNAADANAAVSAANAYLSAVGVKGTAFVSGPATVTVTATVSRAGPISGSTFTVTRTATARLLVGVEAGQSP
jgi:Flp pilus assembly protein TadG